MEDEIRDIMREELDKTGLSPVVFPDVQKVEVINQQAPVVNVPAPIVNITTPEPVNIEPILERIESAISSAPEFDYNRFEKIAKENKSTYQGGAMGPSKLFVRNATGAVISPATEAKQDSIITAIGNIPGGGGVQYTEGDTDASITGTAMLFEGAANTLVVPSATNPMPVSATIDTTGLALAANQLPDGHNVTVDNASLAVTGTFWQATQPVSGTVTATGPLTDTELRATPVPVSGTFYQATQPVSIASMPSTPVTGTFWQATQPISAASLPSHDVTNAGTFAVQQTTYSSSSVTQVSSSASSVQLLASTAGRRGAYFMNDSTAIAYLKLGTTAATNSYTVKMAAGGFYELPYPCYTGRIDCIWASANGVMAITEIT